MSNVTFVGYSINANEFGFSTVTFHLNLQELFHHPSEPALVVGTITPRETTTDNRSAANMTPETIFFNNMLSPDASFICQQ